MWWKGKEKKMDKNEKGEEIWQNLILKEEKNIFPEFLQYLFFFKKGAGENKIFGFLRFSD